MRCQMVLYCYVWISKMFPWLGTVAHACNSSILGGRGEWITWGQEFKTSLAIMVKPHLLKNKKISWAWWRTPVVPATREAEAGKLLEPGSWRWQWAEIVPLHYSLAPGNRAIPCIKKIRVHNYPYTIVNFELKMLAIVKILATCFLYRLQGRKVWR